MPKNGHLSWTAIYQPGTVKAIGYKNGKKILTRNVETTGAPARISLTADRSVIQADNRDVAVFRVELQDKKKRFVPTACPLRLRSTVPCAYSEWAMAIPPIRVRNVLRTPTLIPIR